MYTIYQQTNNLIVNCDRKYWKKFEKGVIGLSKYKIPDEIVNVQIFRKLPLELKVHLINQDNAPLEELYNEELRDLKISLRNDYRPSYQNAYNSIDFEIDSRILEENTGIPVDHYAIPEKEVDKKVVEEYVNSLTIK